MKNRPIIYAQHQYAETSEPIYVVSIEFSPASFEYFASHAGIPDIPVGVIEGCIEDFSSVSQSFDPETGASRIGSLSVLLGDIGEAVTDVFQSRLAAGTGLRDKQLRLYKGFAGLSFNDFELKWTQIIHEVQEDHARYTLSCSDLQRSLRSDIFQLKTTVLDATLSATATVATVADTSDFELVEHGSSYSHGPSQTWGYFLLDDEIIGYTGKTATTFTGLARGLFNTLPAAHEVDLSDPPERRPEVEEYVYLEMPVPKLIKALMTGVLHGQVGTLPAGWHMGIPIASINDAQFTGIGVDLWDPANDAVGLIANFTGLDSIDGKRFIESECFRLAQIFSPVLADGTLGLKRFTPALATAAHLVTLNEQNVAKHSALKHAMREVFNRVVINWSWVSGEFRRQTIKLDTDSIARHGQAPIKIFNFRGLASNIATKSVLDQRFDAIRDRFSAPPLQLTTVVSKSLDRMELGDICLVQLPNVRDASADSVNPIDRAFEIRQIRENRKQLSFVLEGSAAEAVPTPPSQNALPDAYYTQAGTELSTVVTIVGGVTQAGTFTLVGGADLGASVFYYDGNLTIGATTTLNIDDNVQLRVKGFLTVNGVIVGTGRGLAGVADGADVNTNPSGLQGYFGATVGGDGADHDIEEDGYLTRPPLGFVSGVSSLPHLNLLVSGNTLNGLPADLRGCSGGPGGKLVNGLGSQVGLAGTGGAGGSGLAIICRGISFGGGASIDTSGLDGVAPAQQTLGGRAFYAGGGAGGSPGGMYILLDGNQLAPDISNVFTALGGETPVTGTPIPYPFTRGDLLQAPSHTGLLDATRRISSVNWTRGAARVQYVPVPETPVEDLPDADLSIYYILATAGNAIHNGVGQLTVEAHRVTAGTDELLSTGTIKLFDPANQEVTAANGYVAGSDGYTGILDSGDITGDIVITLKDGPAGTPLDTITLVDIADGSTGAPGSDGADAVYGFIEPENGLSWTRATNAGAWTPAQLTTDFDCTFVQAGVEVARIARRLTLNSADGTITATSIAHKGGDLNTSRVTVTLVGNGTTAETVQFAYAFGGENATVAETATSSQGGDDGATGADGADAVYGFVEPENGLAWTRATDGGAWTPSQLTTDLDCKFVQAGIEVARIARRITLNSVDGTLTASTVAHKGGDLNTSRVTVTVTGSASTGITVLFDYSFGGEFASVAQTVSSVQGGETGTSALNAGRRSLNLGLWYSDDGQAARLISPPWSVESVAGPVWPTVIRGVDNLDDSNNVFSERIAIVSGKKYRAAIEVRQPSGDRQNYLLVAFWDSAGDLINNSSVPVSDAVGWNIGTYHYWEIVNAVFPAAFTRYEREFGGDSGVTIPTGAVTMAIGMLALRDGAVGTNTTIEWQDFHIVEVPDAGTFKDVKFIRSATAPATPTGDNPAGWTDTIPAGNNAIYQITGTKTSGGSLIGVWSTPIRIQGLVNRGAYSALTAYLRDDVVQYQERTYVCTTATTGNAPSGTNAGNTWWDLLAGKGDPGDPPSTYTQTISVPAGGTQNLRALANAHTPAYDGVSDATITFQTAGNITGNANGGHGIDTGTWPAGAAINLTLETNGDTIRGGGGQGGAGGGAASNGAPGGDGGDAIYCQEDLTVDNVGGIIEASGGGGGGGGGRTSGGPEPFDYGGGGGGGGFPNGSGGPGGATADFNGSPGSAGTGTGGGGGGAGAGSAGNGGGGGNVNVNGAAGAAATGSGTNGGGGALGERGFAVRKNGHTVTVTGGTVTGQVA